jgi:radical SAM protein (TIGR01212 family)
MSLREVNTIGRYFKKKFKRKVYKIPLSIKGFTCPNIDGTKAKGGCTFCENDSFSPNLEKKGKPKFYITPKTTHNPILEEQLKSMKKQIKETKEKLYKMNKKKKVSFIVYFQSFTNTYAPIDTLRILYNEALKDDDILGISVGTRADSINDEVFDLLLDIQDRGYDVFIEYGVQTVFNKTLEIVNRAEKIEDIISVVKKSKSFGFNICIHLIFGLPKETQEMMLDSLREVISWDIDSIKIHPLYIVKNTALAIDYYNNKFKPISEDLYIDTVVKALEMTPPNITIQRITAGIDNDTILGSDWCKNKNIQMDNIRKELYKIGLDY